jgi:hypothetical protein
MHDAQLARLDELASKFRSAPAASEPDPFSQTLIALDLSARSDEFCQQLYAALCNTGWRRADQAFSCSWRYAGRLVADYDGRSTTSCYLDYYCSGGEGTTSDQVVAALAEHGWQPCPLEVAWAINDPAQANMHLGRLAAHEWLKTHYPGSGTSSRSEDNVIILAPLSEEEIRLEVDRTSGEVFCVSGQERSLLIESPSATKALADNL